MSAVKTPEWYAERVGMITGSRVPRILGLAAGGPESVMREMVREHFGDEPEFTGNRFTRWGEDHEDDAIKQYMIEHHFLVTGRDVFVRHPTIDWLGVHPDGLVERDGSVEAKCPVTATYVHISQRPDYYEQIQAVLEATGRAWCDLIVWRPDPPLWVSRVERDPLWAETRLPVLEAFHDRFLQIIADPDLAAPYRAPLRDVRWDEEWLEAEACFADALTVRDAAEVEVALRRQRLIELSDGRTTRGALFQVTHSLRTGQVDWQQAAKKYAGDDIDPEPFRRKGTKVISVRPIGGNGK